MKGTREAFGGLGAPSKYLSEVSPEIERAGGAIMRAVRIHAFGGPDVLKLEEQPMPTLQADEVLVRIHAASVNPVDYKMRNGGYLPQDRLPLTLGRDVSGVVERAGPAVRDLRVGEAVYAMLPGDRGGYAEFTAVSAVSCAPKPHSLDHVHAAAVPLAALTAWQGIFDHGGLMPGQRMLVHGGAGGVGHFAIQLARTRGATVYATCSKADLGFVHRLGAVEAIDYQNERFESIVSNIDLVFDLVGGDTQDRSWKVLKEGGIMVSTLQEPSTDKASEYGARGIHYMAKPSGTQLMQIARLIDAGQVRAEIDSVFTLADAASAEGRLENGHVRGKVVLAVAG
jgi:NADPH:quinone reductase-like Zn-dependent oxidoreductase